MIDRQLRRNVTIDEELESIFKRRVEATLIAGNRVDGDITRLLDIVEDLRAENEQLKKGKPIPDYIKESFGTRDR